MSKLSIGDSIVLLDESEVYAAIDKKIQAALPAWLPCVTGTATGITSVRGGSIFSLSATGIQVYTSGDMSSSVGGKYTVTSVGSLSFRATGALTLESTSNKMSFNAADGIYTNTDIHIPDDAEQVNLLDLADELEQS